MVFVVRDLGEPPQEVLWNAVLVGGAICLDSFLETGSGPCRAFKPALETQRIVWMTDAFIAAHGGFAHILVSRTGFLIKEETCIRNVDTCIR